MDARVSRCPREDGRGTPGQVGYCTLGPTNLLTGQAHAGWLTRHRVRVDEVVPAAPGLSADRHQAEIRVEVADI
jgi:hypothetical protein